MIIKIAQADQERKDAFQTRHTVFIQEQKVPPDEEMDHFDDNAIHFIGYEDGQSIAASRLRFIDHCGKLERICVLLPYRGKSYGRQLIEAMEKEILIHGFVKAKLNSQSHATEFYEKLGYKIISEEFMDAGIPHVTMTKNLG